MEHFGGDWFKIEAIILTGLGQGWPCFCNILTGKSEI